MTTLQEYIDKLKTAEQTITQLIHDAVDLRRDENGERSNNEIIELTRIRHRVEVIKRHAYDDAHKVNASNNELVF